MPWARVHSTVVIVANRLNPSILSPGWLTEQKILTAEDLQTGFIFTELVAQIPTKQFQMLVVPEQLQFIPTVPEDQEEAVIVEKLGTIVRLLPQTPYRGLGLNFNWHLTPPDEDIAKLSRSLFWHDTPFYRRFGKPTDRFGAYMSTDFGEYRLKLDVKPILIPHENQLLNRLQFLFNFHADLKDNPADFIQRSLRRWNELRRECETIVDSIEARKQS
jgi:hypothetical protein